MRIVDVKMMTEPDMQEIDDSAVVALLTWAESHADKNRDLVSITIAGHTYLPRKKFFDSEISKVNKVEKFRSYLPNYLCWLPIPAANDFLIKLSSTGQIGRCFDELSEQGAFFVDIFDHRYLVKVLEELATSSDANHLVSIASDPLRLSLRLLLDDPRFPSGQCFSLVTGSKTTPINLR